MRAAPRERACGSDRPLVVSGEIKIIPGDYAALMTPQRNALSVPCAGEMLGSAARNAAESRSRGRTGEQPLRG
jgi:hypothetical protein